MTKTIQVIRGGASVDAILVEATATVAANGKTVAIGDDVIDAPDGSTFADVPGAGIGWVVRDGVLQPPVQPPSPPPSKSDLRAAAATCRWQVETRGISIFGSRVATDDRSQRLILGLRVKADANPDFVTRFKGNDGQWFDVNAASIIGISDAVFEHVDAAFTLENDVVDKINDGTITTIAEIEAAFS